MFISSSVSEIRTGIRCGQILVVRSRVGAASPRDNELKATFADCHVALKQRPQADVECFLRRTALAVVRRIQW